MAGLDARTMNVALIGHRSSGKTTLAEHLLAVGRAVREPGSVDAGTTLLDHLDAERRRHMSLQLAVGWIEWDGVTVQLIDTPGSANARYHRSLAIALADVVVVVVDGSEPLHVDAEKSIVEATRAGIPTVVFVNKLDRPHALAGVLDAIADVSAAPSIPVDAVCSDGGTTSALVDLLTRRAAHRDAASGWSGVAWSDDADRWAPQAYEQLCEVVALTDDALLEPFLERMELEPATLKAGLSAALHRGALVPILFGSAAQGFGAERLLDFLVAHAPTADVRPGPVATEYDGTPVRISPDGAGFVAQVLAVQPDKDGNLVQILRVWRGAAPLNKAWFNGDTGQSAKVRKLYRLRGPRRAALKQAGPGALVATWDPLPVRPGDTVTDGERLIIPPPDRPPPMMAYAIRPRSLRDERALPHALDTLLRIDGSLQAGVDDTTGEVVVHGSGPGQLDDAIQRLAELGAEVESGLPAVPFREVPVRSVCNVAGVHRLEDSDGLPVEFGCCAVDVEPNSDDSIGFEDAFPDAEELPRRFRPAIDEGVRLALQRGPMAGYPVLGARVRLTGGEYDILQSTEDHFRIAGELAARAALEQAGTRLLEPWWQVDVYTPSGDVGSVISELTSLRGRVVGLEVVQDETRVCVHIPYRELRSFAPRLEAVCGGRGRFFGEPSHYEQAPDDLIPEALASAPSSRAS